MSAFHDEKLVADTVGRRVARVLLVEDSPAQALLVTRAVNEVEFLELVHVARDGEEALAFLRREGRFEKAEIPDLILLDLHLPKQNGLEVLSAVKRDDRLRTMPVVMLTTSDHEQDVIECYRRGANTFYTKPLSFNGLMAILHDLGRYWSAAKLATV
jgi:DNA-binding response OmpR family regulator